MKFRFGFVSNSSSSSFTCPTCNTAYSGYDCYPGEDRNHRTCENGHVFCGDLYKPEEIIFTDELKKKARELYLKNVTERNNSYHRTMTPQEIEKKIKRLMEDFDASSDENKLSHYKDLTGYDSWHDISMNYCPICTMKVVAAQDVFAFLVKGTNLSYEQLVEGIKAKYQGNYKQFQEDIKGAGIPKFHSESDN